MEQRQGERHAPKLSASCGDVDKDSPVATIYAPKFHAAKLKGPARRAGPFKESIQAEVLAVAVAPVLAALLLTAMLAALSGVLGLLAGLLPAALLLAGLARLLLAALLARIRILRILAH
jgi:hypothetical protein